MSTFLTAEWRKLIMAQYAVEPSVLAPYLPQGLELDLFRDDGRSLCFVSLVGFLFDRVRLKGIAIPFHTRFEEVNLRFYVKRPITGAQPAAQPGADARRGVVFLSEIVPRPAITFVARVLYGEAYSTAPTRHHWRTTADELAVGYDWKHRGRWQSLSVRAAPQSQPIAPHSLEEFITEHYWGYTKGRGLGRRAGNTGEYGVVHPRWQVYPVRSAHVEADFGSLYGPAFASLTQRAPDHVLLAEGSAIEIRSERRSVEPNIR